jgi:polyisoprenoid-binding protein YceI
MRRIVVPVALLIALVAVRGAAAETHEYVVDPVHSEVGFKVKHLVSKTSGRFEEYDGRVWLDPANVEGTLKFSATIQAASVNTQNEKRDRHLETEDFFDVPNHPEVKFESSSVKKAGENYEVSGNLTMRGVTKPVTLIAEVTGTGTNPWTAMPMVGVDLTGKVNRKDFGINWNNALDTGGFVLGDDVWIEIHIEASVPKAS